MSKKWFRSETLRLPPQRVDRMNGAGVIYGYAVITRGLVESYGFEVDDVMLRQVVAQGNGWKTGTKSRFGHPGMSSTALGTFLGRARQFRLDGDDVVRADLHLDPTSRSTPKGDLGLYVMDLAESDPEAFGSSIVFKSREVMRVNKDGTRATGPDGKELPPLVRCERLLASDIVDSPAANPGGMFDETGVELSAKAWATLDRLLSSPGAEDLIFQFADRYFRWRFPDHTQPGGIMSEPTPAETPETTEEVRDDTLFERLGRLLSGRRGGVLTEVDQEDVQTLHSAAVEADRRALREDRARLAVDRDLDPHRSAIEPQHLKIEPLMLKLKAAELGGDAAAGDEYEGLRELLPKLHSPKAGGPLATDDAGALVADTAELTAGRRSIEERLGHERMAELKKKYPTLRGA